MVEMKTSIQRKKGGTQNETKIPNEPIKEFVIFSGTVIRPKLTNIGR